MVDFPFIPNWRNGVTVRLSHKTDIFTTRDGHEQRRSLRETPRRSLEFAVQLHESERTRFHAIMSAEAFSVADPVTFTTVAADAEAGGSTLAVDDSGWISDGQRVAVRNGHRWQFITVTTSGDGLLTLEDPVTAQQAAGAKVHGVLEGRFTLDGSGLALTSRLETYSLTFDVEPGTEYVVPTTGGSDIFDGREVWMKPPNWVKSPSIELRQERDTTDYEFGRVSHTVPVNWMANVTQADYMNVNVAAAARLVELFHRTAGRAGEMFVPTWRDDMTPAADLAEAASTISVAGTEVAEFFDDHPVYRAFVVVLHDGRRLFRKIVSMATSGGNTVLTVNREWSFDVGVADIKAIHWLPLQRFATDDLTIDYLTDEVSQFRVSTMTLPYAVSEATIDDWTVFADVATEMLVDWVPWVDRFDIALNISWPLLHEIEIYGAMDRLRIGVNYTYPLIT